MGECLYSFTDAASDIVRILGCSWEKRGRQVCTAFYQQPFLNLNPPTSCLPVRHTHCTWPTGHSERDPSGKRGIARAGAYVVTLATRPFPACTHGTVYFFGHSPNCIGQIRTAHFLIWQNLWQKRRNLQRHESPHVE